MQEVPVLSKRESNSQLMPTHILHGWKCTTDEIEGYTQGGGSERTASEARFLGDVYGHSRGSLSPSDVSVNVLVSGSSSLCLDVVEPQGTGSDSNGGMIPIMKNTTEYRCRAAELRL